MGFKSSHLLCLAIFLVASSAIHAMNIVKILGEYPEYGAFTKYLTETKLADQINRRNTITILAISNSSLGDISSKPMHAIKAVLSTHVVLDYFDERKLVEAVNGNETLTTLYQASGLAQYSQGFLRVGLVGDGEIAFGSAADGAPLNSELVKTVTSIPYNVSILEVARAIRVPGIDSITLAQPPVVPYKPGPAQAPPPEEVVAPSPGDDETEAEAPVDAPTTTPVSSPSKAPAPVAADQAAADAPPPSSSSRTTVGLVGAVMGFTSLLVAM